MKMPKIKLPKFTLPAVKMPNRKSMILIGAVVIALFAGALMLLTREPEKPVEKAQPKAALTVSLTAPQKVEWPVSYVANGNVAAWQEAIIGTEANGRSIVAIRANVGDRVRKGQILALLQSDMVVAQLKQAQAGLVEAQALQAEAKANADRARQVQKSGALSAQQVAQYLTAEQTAAAKVASMKAQVKSAEVLLAQSKIIAPDDGTITARNATLGAVVSPGNELFRLNRLDRLEWRAEVPAAEIARIKAGQTATVYANGKSKIQGKVRVAAPTVEQQTRNGLVYVDLPDKSDVRAGMFVRGEIEMGKAEMLVLPQTAVLLRDGFSYVFKVDQSGRVAQTKITVGQRSGEYVAITSGVDGSTQVAAEGVAFLADGDVVRVVQAKAK
ncbi:MAG: secretion protein HlyD family protein [Burkholderiaceae bacterium]|nr:secretion protein HlyD family protein [Burkholderiaceae bacterium]